MTRLTFACLLATASSFAPAQTPPPAGVTIRTTTTLVQVSVSAQDSKGRPVTDLKKEDFALFDNGKQQQIEVLYGEAGARVPQPATPRAPAAQTNASPPARQGGSAVILLDWANTGFRNSARARAQARKMMQRLGPEERVGLYSFDRNGLKVVNEIGADRADILRSLDTLTGQPYPCFQPQMDGLDDKLPPGDDNMKICGGSGPLAHAVKDFWVDHRTRDTLAVFESIAARMAGSQGRKALIWITSAFPLDSDMGGVDHYGSVVDRAMHRLNNAGISLYPVDARGLTIDSMVDADNDTWPTMDNFAERTGGVTFKGRNDLDDGMQAAIEDMDTSYTLGFYAPQDSSQMGFHKLTVRSLRPGVTLRYKEGYSIGPPSSPPPEIPGAQARSAELAALLAELKAAQPASPAPGAAPALPGAVAPPPAAVPPPLPANTPEITTHETTLTFRSRVNLVTVPVVVRDSKKIAIDNLDKDDFQLFDGGKPQIISRFSVEEAPQPAPSPTPAAPRGAPDAPQPAAPVAMPQRYVALVIDDLHTQFGDLVWARQAAQRFLAANGNNGERFAVYTTSGQNNIDFTSDRDALNKTLLAITPREKSSNDCPQITYFEADRVLNKDDTELLRILGDELQACRDQTYTTDEKNYTVSENARRVLMEGDWNTRQTINTLRAVIGKLATMPGRRSLVQISDGFLLLDEHRPEEMSLMESAIHANVVIDSLNSAGLRAYVPGGDASRHGSMTPEAQRAKIRYDQEGDDAAAAALDETARGTGGRYFHNSNDMDEGIKLLAGAPETVYLLGFAPQNLKFDGRYHALKVTLRDPKGYTIEARPGYYAPNHAADPAEQSKEEIQAAFFSTEDIREIPATMEAQFFKTGPDDATVDILARVDIKQLNFKQQDGRNRNDVTVVSGLFDENGNYVAGIQETLELRLKDETLATRLATGMVVRSSIKTKPGRYLVRVVVRDAEGQELSALSKAVEIQ